MKCNVGGADRGVRIVVGIALMAWGVYASSWWGALGVLPLATGLVRWCPGYRLFHIETCKTPAAPTTTR